MDGYMILNTYYVPHKTMCLAKKNPHPTTPKRFVIHSSNDNFIVITSVPTQHMSIIYTYLNKTKKQKSLLE